MGITDDILGGQRRLRLICEACNAYFWIERSWTGEVACPYCGKKKDVKAD